MFNKYISFDIILKFFTHIVYTTQHQTFDYTFVGERIWGYWCVCYEMTGQYIKIND